MNYSGYRFMWLQVHFDLPVKKKPDRKAASEFRHFLLDLGFEMSQFSVYQRFCSSREKADAMVKKLERHLPNKGKIHILMFTDKQYENMKTFRGKSPENKKNHPDQLLLF